MLSVIPICALVRHLQGMLDVQFSFDERDYEHASVIKMDFYHLQNIPQIKCSPGYQGYIFCYIQIELL